ncbi:MAG: glycosyltransferase family 1 protein [Gemmatimonadaceae bacterium]|nr:glycosyltransferase family 1 protein [Gemmatimonadaceae bacterium]
MARIVINSWGSYGDVNPYLALGVALAERGHDVVMALPAHFRADVERVGLTLAPVGLVLDEQAPETQAMVERILDARRGAEYIYRRLILPTIRDTYAQLASAAAGADLLVSHPLGIGAPPLAEKTGIRWASTVLAPISFASRHEMVVPPQAPWLKGLERFGPSVPHFFGWFMRVFTERWTEPVQTFRAALGLPRGAHAIFEGQYSAPLVLAMFSRVLAAPQPDWPSNTVVTGQLVNDTPQGVELPETLRTFLSIGDAPVVFTLGSSAVRHSGTFFDESIHAMHRVGRRAVFLAGADVTARLAHTLPPHMLMIEQAPHSLLFPRAALVVHQAGVGTLGTALRAGVPTLAVPFANDQPDNAYRIAALGTSVTMYPSQYRATAVADTLAAMLSDRGRAARAAAIGEQVRAEGGAEHACACLEAYLRSARSVRPATPNATFSPNRPTRT